MTLARPVFEVAMERIPSLLLIAWLLPLRVVRGDLRSAIRCRRFFGIRVRYSTQKYAGYIAVAAIVTGLPAEHVRPCSATGSPPIRSIRRRARSHLAERGMRLLHGEARSSSR